MNPKLAVSALVGALSLSGCYYVPYGYYPPYPGPPVGTAQTQQDMPAGTSGTVEGGAAQGNYNPPSGDPSAQQQQQQPQSQQQQYAVALPPPPATYAPYPAYYPGYPVYAPYPAYYGAYPAYGYGYAPSVSIGFGWWGGGGCCWHGGGGWHGGGSGWHH